MFTACDARHVVLAICNDEKRCPAREIGILVEQVNSRLQSGSAAATHADRTRDIPGTHESLVVGSSVAENTRTSLTSRAML